MTRISKQRKLGSTRKLKSVIFKLVATAVLGIAAIGMILPFIWMVSTSLKPSNEVFDFPIKWIPSTFDFTYYVDVWTGSDSLGRYYVNSIITTVIPLIAGVFTCSLAAYGFTKIEFPGRELLFLLYVSLMMIPTQALIVPKFLMFKSVGMFNTHFALILPHCFSIVGVFLMRQNFLSIPLELSESARVDGANDWLIYSKIILPLAKPIIATYSILAFTWYWNDFENPMVFISSQNLYTLPLALNKFVLEDGIDYSRMMAVASSAIFPLFLVFVFAQRFVIESVASSGIKG